MVTREAESGVATVGNCRFAPLDESNAESPLHELIFDAMPG
jgi:hypothetical protein